MPTPTEKESLEYGQPVPVHRRRWVHRASIGAAVFVVALVVLFNAPRAARLAWVMYWQHKCMAYEVPADQPVNGTGLPEVFSDYANAIGAQPTGDLVFLHEIPRDDPVLVCVTIDPAATAQMKHPALAWHMFRPISITDHQPWWSSSQFSAYTGLPMDAKIFGGRFDPKDPERVIIEYEADGKKGVIDAWLLPNALRIQMREPPNLFPTVEQ
jgi:hypothetical protein